jgi:hypothetical protein
MKREVAIFIETDIAQAELEFSRLELFNDEKISVTSTIQNISDISKIFTDFSQGFTIPCSPINNAIFQHFYQNDVDATIDFQKRYNAYIEVDTVLFRRGKIQLEKTNLKNGQPDSYSVTFYGAGVSLKDYFNEDKLSQLDYSTLDHLYTNQELYDRVTIDSSVTDYDVRYPLISSNRVWQFSGSVPIPDANVPSWYDNSADNSKNIGDNAGRMFYTELFPAVRVASIFDLIQSEYEITFNGLFLTSDMFKKAFLFFKNKDLFNVTTGSPVDLNFTSPTGTLASAFNTTNGTFTVVQLPIANNEQLHGLDFEVTTMSVAVTYYIYVYINGVFNTSFTGTSTNVLFGITVTNLSSVVTFKINSSAISTIGLSFEYKRANYLTFALETGTATASVTTIGVYKFTISCARYKNYRFYFRYMQGI